MVLASPRATKVVDVLRLPKLVSLLRLMLLALLRGLTLFDMLRSPMSTLTLATLPDLSLMLFSVSSRYLLSLISMLPLMP